MSGATIIDTPALQALLGQVPAPVLIDVYRRQWLQGRFIEDQPHANLPGSRFGAEFFIRKALGWALRDYARTDPDWVRAFVAEHERRLSGLSRREALKHLG